MTTCPNCAHLQAEVNRLQAENAALRRRVAQLESGLRRARLVIQYQKSQLDAARITCWDYIQKAREAMGGHLPRATWSLWKGRAEAARSIYSTVAQDYGTGMLAEIAGLLGW